ncbi:MAG: hypothetical protein OXG58_05315 [Gemmatimonadetes bacterium]|nr:hypothetical protein [Gemmatimonadota bacterium]
MNAFLYITLPTMGINALRRWLPLMVVGSLLWACDDDNQVPFAKVDTLPATKVMTERSRQEYYVAQYFRDPDQDPLSFSASIEDATVATAVVEDENDSITLVIDGVAAGETIVTLTAIDPDGGEAQISGRVLVVEPVLFWRDDFDFDNGEWSFSGRYSFDHRPGYLSAIGVDGLFSAQRVDADDAVDWLISMSAGAEGIGSDQTVGFWMYGTGANLSKRWLWGTVGGAELEPYVADPVPGANWRILWCCRYTWGGGGISDAVNLDGEFTEIHWGVRFGRIELFIGETVVWGEDTEDGNEFASYGTFSSYSEGEGTDRWVYFDWAELWGIPAEEGEGYLAGERELQEDSESLGITPFAPLVSYGTGIVAQ